MLLALNVRLSAAVHELVPKWLVELRCVCLFTRRIVLYHSLE